MNEQLFQNKTEVNKYPDTPAFQVSSDQMTSPLQKVRESCGFLGWRAMIMLKHVIFLNCLRTWDMWLPPETLVDINSTTNAYQLPV